VASAVHAAPPTLDIPAEVRPAGQYALFTPRTDAVAVEFVGLDALEPVPSSVLKDARTFLLDTRGLKAGRYRFVAVGSSAAGELVRVGFALVVGESPVPPGPTPPNPPAPDDPLLPTLRSVYAALVNEQATRREDVRRLAVIMRESAPVCDNPQLATYGQLSAAVSSVTVQAVPLTRLAPVRDVVRAEYVRQFGEPADQPLTPELRSKLKAMFLRVATLYEELGK